MPNVLLITDSPRVKKIFEGIGATGIMQLRTAATLAQGDHEIAESLPAVTFIQSRISGVSAEIVLHHLKKILPAQATVVLLANDAADLETVRKHGERVLDLALQDGDLTSAIHEALSGVFAPPAPDHRQDKPGKGAGEPDPFALDTVSVRAASPEEKTGARDDFSIFPESQTPQPPGPKFEEILQVKEGSDPQALHPLQGEFGYGRSLADAIASAEQEKRRKLVTTAVIGAVLVSFLCFFALRKPGHPRKAVQDAPAAASVARASAQKAPHSAVSGGNKPTDAAKSPASATPAPVPHPAPSRPAAATPAPLPTASVSPAASAPGAKGAPNVAVSPAIKAPSAVVAQGSYPPRAAGKEAPKGGPAAAAPTMAAPAAARSTPSANLEVRPRAAGRELTALPAIVSGNRIDPSYGKSHPGWERYIGTVAEYKVFREGSRIKALQVIAKGESIPHPLLFRVLRDFAGIDRYRVQSRTAQENYLVERGEGEGGVGVTVYRRKADKRMKGLVLYFR